MSWRAQNRPEDAKTPSAGRGMSEKPEPDPCPIQPYAVWGQQVSKDVDDEVNGLPQDNMRKRKHDEPIDHHKVEVVKNLAKSMGMTCANKPNWSAQVNQEASMHAPKDEEGGDACSCIRHGFLVYGGSKMLSAYLAKNCPIEGGAGRTSVDSSTDPLIRAHIWPQKLQEGTVVKDNRWALCCDIVCIYVIAQIHICAFL
jgi:hypothetical protein